MFLCVLQRETTGVLASVLGYSSTVATYAAGVILPWRELATMLMFLGVPYALGMLFYVIMENYSDAVHCVGITLSYGFGDRFLANSSGLVGITTAAMRPRLVVYSSSNFQ